MTQVSAKFQSPDDHVLEVTITATVKEWREIVKAIHGRYFFNPLEDIAVDVRKAFDQVEQTFTPPVKVGGEWIEHHGGECPVPANTLIDVRWRNVIGPENPICAGKYGWAHTGGAWDIIAYRIHDPDFDEVG